MITLAKFGPAFGLSDISPFVLKVEILLRMAGLDYRVDSSMAAFRHAPKGKLPYIVDDGAMIADSTFIRFHLERKYGIDFDAGLTDEQRAQGWAFEKMVENHLYWATTYSRFIEEGNFAVMKAQFFDKLSPVIRPIVVAMTLRNTRNNLKGQGFGRHTRDEIYELGRRDLAAVAAALGDKPFFHGARPKAVDASLGGTLLSLLCDAFETPYEPVIQQNPNLVAYATRIKAQFFGTEQAEAA